MIGTVPSVSSCHTGYQPGMDTLLSVGLSAYRGVCPQTAHSGLQFKGS